MMEMKLYTPLQLLFINKKVYFCTDKLKDKTKYLYMYNSSYKLLCNDCISYKKKQYIYSHAIEKMEDENRTLDPSFHGYQLVGDSQMVRFGEQILGLQRLQTPTSNIRF